MRKIIALLAALLFASPALAQSIQLGAGQVLGNSTTAQRPGRAENVTAIIDRALGSTRGALLERGASGWGLLLPGATAGQIIRSGGTGADPAYSTATYPATTTINQLLYSSAGNVIGGLATANSSILVTDSGGIPSLSTTLPAHTYSTTLTGVSTNAAALAIGRQGVVNPVLQVDASTASVVTGVKITGAAAGNGVVLAAISSGADEAITINPKGNGTVLANTTGGTGTFSVGAIGRFSVAPSTGYVGIGAGPTSTEGLTVVTPGGTINQIKVRDSSSTGTIVSQGAGGAFQFNNQDNSTISFFTNNGSGEQFILGTSGNGLKIGASAPAPGAQGLGVGGQIVAAGAIQTTGANAGFLATDRASDTNNSWTIYSASNSLRFFNSQAASDLLTITKNTGAAAFTGAISSLDSISTSKSTNGAFTAFSGTNGNTGASANVTDNFAVTDAGTFSLQAVSAAGGAFAITRWTGSGGTFFDQKNAAGSMGFRTGATPSDVLTLDANQNAIFNNPITTGGDSRVSSDFTVTSSTTLTNVTGLTTNVQASGTYGFQAMLLTTANASGGVKAGIGGTATVTNLYVTAAYFASIGFASYGTATALATAMGGSTTAVDATIMINGTITVNAAGTLTSMFAQNASFGTGSVVKRGSWMKVWKIT